MSQQSGRDGHSRSNTSHASSSPQNSHLSRPQWPWQSYAHRSASSSSSLPSASASPAPMSLASAPNWESGGSVGSTHWAPNNNTTPTRPGHSSMSSTTAGSTAAGIVEEQSMRQWTFTALEWTVRNVKSLREYVETQKTTEPEGAIGSNASDAEDDSPDVLRESPIVGDGKYKLEIARSPTSEEGYAASGAIHAPGEGLPAAVISELPTLSVFITSLFLDSAHVDYGMPASIMCAIKCPSSRTGERGGRDDWVWEVWDHHWCFRRESEFWECKLPSLSGLLQHQSINEQDAFVLSIQIHSPNGPFFPRQPSAYYVPRDLIEGLESSLDNANTGDVRFVSLERFPPSSTPVGSTTPHSRRSSSSSSPSFARTATARKRVIYAHSDILKRRSEYFATMLSSSFSETSSTAAILGERRVHTVIVEDADFVTVYWLLKWIYGNWLLFKEEDDPRAVIDGMSTDWSANLLGVGHSEWDWRRVITRGPPSDSTESLEGEGRLSRSVASVESLDSKAGDRDIKGKGTYAGPSNSSTSSAGPSHNPGSLRTRIASPTTHHPTSKPPGSHLLASTAGQTRPRSSFPDQSATRKPYSSTRQPVSPMQPLHAPSFHQPNAPTPDPHPHPTPEPPAASALSVFQIAHRYNIPALSALALDHIMTTMSPTSSFPLLLATHFWDDLHAFIQDYIVERWEAVVSSEEFEQGCQEVAAGEWGPEGGRTLAALFRRLQSPNLLMRYPRG